MRTCSVLLFVGLLGYAVACGEELVGGQILAKTTFVQRLNTRGGAAPTSICTVGQAQLVPYTADYVFFHKN